MDGELYEKVIGAQVSHVELFYIFFYNLTASSEKSCY